MILRGQQRERRVLRPPVLPRVAVDRIQRGEQVGSQPPPGAPVGTTLTQVVAMA